MCEENIGKRRQLSLDKNLQTSLERRCTLLKHDAQQPLPSSSSDGNSWRLKECFGFGVCVCAENTHGMAFFQNLAGHLRRVCWKRKDKKSKKVSMSEARRILEESRMVLQICAVASKEAAIDNWEDALLSDKPATVNPGAEENVRYLHVGRINLSSYHFAVTELVRAETVPGIHDENVVYVRGTGDDADVKTDVQVLAGCSFFRFSQCSVILRF